MFLFQQLLSYVYGGFSLAVRTLDGRFIIEDISKQHLPNSQNLFKSDLPCLKDHQLKTLQSVRSKAFILIMWEVDLRANIYRGRPSSR